MVDITLTHASVNSGNAVELNGVRVSYAWKNFVQGKSIIGINDINSVAQNGFESPLITIKGVWDIDDQTDINTAATGASGNSIICQKLLVDFATLQSTTAITLAVLSGVNQTALGGRPTAGYSSGANTLLSTINVSIKAFTIGFDTGISEGQKWDYSITLAETT